MVWGDDREERAPEAISDSDEQTGRKRQRQEETARLRRRITDLESDLDGLGNENVRLGNETVRLSRRIADLELFIGQQVAVIEDLKQKILAFVRSVKNMQQLAELASTVTGIASITSVSVRADQDPEARGSQWTATSRLRVQAEDSDASWEGSEPMEDGYRRETPAILGLGIMIGFNIREVEGKCIIDCGANKTVACVDLIHEYQRMFHAVFNHDDPFVARPEIDHITMTFANGERGSSIGTCMVPLPLGDKYGQVEVRLVEQPTPFLLSVMVLRKLGIVIDFDTGHAVSKGTGISFKLESLSSGHFYIDLYKPLRRFNPEGFETAFREHLENSACFSAEGPAKPPTSSEGPR